MLYHEEIAEIFAVALRRSNFSGRCEYFSGNSMFAADLYLVGILLRDHRNKTPVRKFWDEMEAFLRGVAESKTFNYLDMEYVGKRALLAEKLFHGTFLLLNGSMIGSFPSGFFPELIESAFYRTLVEASATK